MTVITSNTRMVRNSLQKILPELVRNALNTIVIKCKAEGNKIIKKSILGCKSLY